MIRDPLGILFYLIILFICYRLMGKTNVGLITYLVLVAMASSIFIFFYYYFLPDNPQDYTKHYVVSSERDEKLAEFFYRLGLYILLACLLSSLLFISIIWYFVQKSYSRWQLQNKNKLQKR